MPPTYKQANRPMTVTTPLGPDVLLLVGFSGHEAISQLFSFELDLAAEDQTKVVFEKLLGRKVTVNLSVPGGQKRHFSGICTSLSQGMRGTDHTSFQMEVSPHLWLLTLRSRSWIFQNMSVPEILKKVLDIPDVVYELEGHFHPRTYCVQYRETDFNFVSRLMEEEGIYYFFKHNADSHQLVVSNKAAFPELQPAELIFQQAEGTQVQEERISRWQKRQQLRSVKVTLRDYHFEMPQKSLEAAQEIQDDVKVGKVTHKLKIGDSDGLEVYDWPGDYAHRFDAIDRGGAERPDELLKLLQDNERTAKIRMEQEAAESIAIQGASRYRHLVSGHTFTLKEQVVVPYDGSSGHDGKYVLTSVNHTGRISGSFRSGDVQELHYDNSFTCIPAALHYRPQRTTPRPVITGTQTAVVVGPKGKEVFVDKYGRVKVQFHWDRQGKQDADSSCWVRVSQIWAGKNWGAFFWPRVGHEVVIAFEEGDPDRPIIVGSVYNAENMPPLPLPASYLLNGIKSCSERGKPHAKYNGLVFHDDLGNEHLQIHSEKHNISTNESSKRTHVGAIHQHVVGGVPLPGSGSGGGNGGGGDDQPFQMGGADLGLNLDLTIGEKYEGTLGLKFEQRLGGKLEFYASPDFTSNSVPPSDPPTFLLALGALLGKTEIKMTTEASLLYGIKIDIHHGKSVETSPKEWTMHDMGPHLLALMGSLQLAAALLGGTLNSSDDFWKSAEWFLLQLPWQLLAVLLYNFECLHAIVDAADKEGDLIKEDVDRLEKQVAAVAAETTQKLSKYVSLLGQWIKKNIIDQIGIDPAVLEELRRAGQAPYP